MSTAIVHLISNEAAMGMIAARRDAEPWINNMHTTLVEKGECSVNGPAEKSIRNFFRALDRIEQELREQ